MDLRIRRLNTRLGDTVEAQRAVFGRVAAHSLPAALDVALPAMLRRLGWSEDAEILIRMVHVRVATDGLATDTELAAMWATAIVEDLARLLAVRPPGSPVDDHAVAVFPTRAHAEAAWVDAAVLRQRMPWWTSPLFPGGPPSVADVVARLSAGAPGLVLALLADVLREAPGRLAELVPAGRVAALESALWPSHAVDTPAAAWSQVGGLDVLQEALEALPGAAHRRLAARVWVARVAPGLQERVDPEAVLRLASSPAGGVEPGRFPEADPGAAGPDRRRASDPSSGLRDAADEVPADPLGVRAAVVVARPPAAAPGPSPTRANPPDEVPWTRPIADHAVSAGGLLFLLRPALRIACPSPTLAWTDLLLALGLAALDRLGGPAPPGLRRERLEAEAPLLAVLGGLDLPPSEPHLINPGAEARQAAAEVLAALVAGLPGDLTVDRISAGRFLGGHPPTWAPGDSSLAAVVLRAGTLRLSRTDAELDLPERLIDPRLRRLGLDVDPGWTPPVGRTVRFHYVPR